MRPDFAKVLKLIDEAPLGTTCLRVGDFRVEVVKGETRRISRVLVANRGEIAVRVIRACRSLGLESVAAVSEADTDSLAAKLADRAVCIGPARPADSYLNVSAIVAAARGAGANALHPGYGFLAEQPRLAQACGENGIVFIGPSAQLIEQMGNKILARQLAAKFGVPVVPGSEKVDSVEEALRAGETIGFPLLLKAAAGGGGRGMRVVNEMSELKGAFQAASSEARAAFGDGTLYVERYIRSARHIEAQILADHFGNVIHLGERDCSLQRRFQKVVEESPAPHLDGLREQIWQAATTLARATGYRNAGTIEFIVDQDEDRFYFLEMNTRIQVEHPVSEMITGVDIVREQIRIAAGEPLSVSQDQVRFDGHAIECRINAESPEQGFRPSPGRIRVWKEPGGVRVDTHCYPGYLVPPYYDSLIAKVIAHAGTRADALRKMDAALATFSVEGVDTTIGFLRSLVNHPDVQNGRTHVRWIENRRL
ncbi:MAG: acetyl-CoA carboxylase biotin carboxylase subunit [Betaproteobacteria bacterium]|nr:MAG: acetyl-CoA carboxylase biotin carboxylase subunit [Betaproteobacteria bacterium]